MFLLPYYCCSFSKILNALISNLFLIYLRPWYVETTTPEPKDMVIVIDRSSVMESQSSSDTKTLMDVAIDAARTVLNTLTPNDRVS